MRTATSDKLASPQGRGFYGFPPEAIEIKLEMSCSSASKKKLQETSVDFCFLRNKHSGIAKCWLEPEFPDAGQVREVFQEFCITKQV